MWSCLSSGSPARIFRRVTPITGRADACIRPSYQPRTEPDPDESYSPRPRWQGPDRIQESPSLAQRRCYPLASCVIHLFLPRSVVFILTSARCNCAPLEQSLTHLSFLLGNLHSRSDTPRPVPRSDASRSRLLLHKRSPASNPL